MPLSLIDLLRNLPIYHRRKGYWSCCEQDGNPKLFDSHYLWFSPVFRLEHGVLQEVTRRDRGEGDPGQPGQDVPLPHQAELSPRNTVQDGSSAPARSFTEAVYRALLLRRGRGRARPQVPFRSDRKAAPAPGGGHWPQERTTKKEMETLADGRAGLLDIAVRGYVTNIADYISAADIVVGKSGPNEVL